MNRLFDTLEICLQEIEKGRELESILAQHPDLADELRPILQTAIKARSVTTPEPTSDVQRRGRARVMQRAAELREAKIALRKPVVRVIPIFQRFALSFTLLLILMLSGTGIVNASSSALPGESLYPVKRGWEGLRLFFIFDSQARQLLADEFENERIHEANELLLEGRHETIQIAGVFMQVNGTSYISGLPVMLPATIQIPENGAAVVATGRTNAQGFVEVTSLELLPFGSVVPAGLPIEMEAESNSDSSSGSESKPNSGAGSAGVTQPTQPAYYEFQGTLQTISNTTLTVNDMTVYLKDSKVKDQLCVGQTVEVKGYYAEDGRFVVTEVEGKGSCDSGRENGGSQNSGSSNNNGQDNSSQNSGSDSGSNSNESHDSHDDSSDNSNDNDSSSGHGGGDDNGGGDNNDD